MRKTKCPAQSYQAIEDRNVLGDTYLLWRSCGKSNGTDIVSIKSIAAASISSIHPNYCEGERLLMLAGCQGKKKVLDEWQTP